MSVPFPSKTRERILNGIFWACVLCVIGYFVLHFLGRA